MLSHSDKQNLDSTYKWNMASLTIYGALMVTANVEEFSRVPGLVVENWIAA